MMKRTTITSIVGVALLAQVALAGPAEEAGAILRTTGIRGGLIVHLGCGDGKLTAALRAGEGYLVHGLDADADNVRGARKHIQSMDAYGGVSVDRLAGSDLPYAENLVNLVVAEALGAVNMAEVMRVLCPGGVAYVKAGGGWRKTVKGRPGDIDEWTHFLHGPGNNAVAADAVVDIPRRMQWLGEPKFARAHEQLASLSACVTTGGRVFYIVDETPRADIRFPSKWALVARDAFNGVVLWKRSMGDWADQFRRFRAGPAGTCFRLAAVDSLVYVTLAIDAPVSILDAATGKTLATCAGTGNARQVLRIGEKLIVLIDAAPQVSAGEDAAIRRGTKAAPGVRAIVACDAVSGRRLWRKEIKSFVHPAVAARGDRLFYQTNEGLFCIDLKAGEPLWQAERKMALTGHEAGWESPTLLAHGPNVYCADFKTIVAYSAADGAKLWQGAARAGYNAPPDIFVIDGLVWMQGNGIVGLDPATGKEKKRVPFVRGYMHHRCYRNKATERFILRGDQGVQFVDRASGDTSLHHWIRGTCQYGIMPANGLLYITPDSCACNMKSKLAGFWALAPAGGERARARPPGKRLEKGPAFGAVNPRSAIPNPQSKDWPVYRHDFARSGITAAKVPAALKPAWKADLGGRLSGVTVDGGKVFVASVDTHTVYALSETSGETLWRFTAGGRVDTPPTIYKGMALFGSADGWIYALRAADGELVWRFRAAPEARLTFANGQLESVWPVHGTVVVHGGSLVVAAGRSSYLDGGIHVYRLDPQTGRRLSATVMYSPDPKTGKQPAGGGRDVKGVLSDILLADGADVYMRHVKLDLTSGDQTGKGEHLFSPIGLLDDTWWHRAYWIVGDHFTAHWSGWWRVGNQIPSGRILSYDGDSIFGYGRDKYPSGNTGQWRGGEKYHLFACDRKPPAKKPAAAPPAPARNDPAARRRRRPRPTVLGPERYRWTRKTPFYVRAMVVAAGTLFVAGPPEQTKTAGSALQLDDPAEALAAWNGDKGAVLWAVSAADGTKLAERRLETPPVFDGMAAVNGRLFIVTTDGKVLCLGDGK